MNPIMKQQEQMMRRLQEQQRIRREQQRAQREQWRMLQDQQRRLHQMAYWEEQNRKKAGEKKNLLKLKGIPKMNFTPVAEPGIGSHAPVLEKSPSRWKRGVFYIVLLLIAILLYLVFV